MLNPLSDTHCAKVLLQWSEHYIARAKVDYENKSALLDAETVKLGVERRLFEAEEKRRSESGDWSGGFGPPTPDQLHGEYLKRLTLDAEEAHRILSNNQDMLLYIKRLTNPDLPIP